jgi:hypothetical protein
MVLEYGRHRGEIWIFVLCPKCEDNGTDSWIKWKPKTAKE